jgi:hypothetical protein
MPRARQYLNAAERQAAYRERHRGEQPAREGLLASLARSLHACLRDAVRADQSALPAELLGHRADDTLRNLIRYIRRHTEGGEAGKTDPVLAPPGSPTEDL